MLVRRAIYSASIYQYCKRISPQFLVVPNDILVAPIPAPTPSPIPAAFQYHMSTTASLSILSRNNPTRQSPFPPTKMAGVVGVRRSKRLRGIAADASNGSEDDLVESSTSTSTFRTKAKAKGQAKTTGKKTRVSSRTVKKNTPPTKRRNKTKSTIPKTNQAGAAEFPVCLPRTREDELKQEQQQQHPSNKLEVIGVDEAGRGPLAGPVVAAAAIIPTDIPGITDSKKITKEEIREELYEKIISSPNARWAVAIGDATRIDEINILQATLESMRNAVQSIIVERRIRKTSKEDVECNSNSEETNNGIDIYMSYGGEN
jgi:hypothetical protein